MIEIGENLKYKHFQFHKLEDRTLFLKDSFGNVIDLKIQEVDSVKIAGINKNSEFSGTMDWGMRNPTVLLPTNFFYNIINLFRKRKNEVVLYSILLKDGKRYIVHTPSNHGINLLKLNR